MADIYPLKSVGSYIQSDGVVGPLLSDGLPELSERIQSHINDGGISEEWLDSLSPEDLATVEAVKKELND
jgi:hypothetical protein